VAKVAIIVPAVSSNLPAGDRGTRVVVVSPHSDDGVLSLGAAMSSLARAGRVVELLTVFALDPESAAPTEGWDHRAGFATERDAALARREEDRRACAALGVMPSWLPFGSVDYERHGEADDVYAAVAGRVEGAEAVLLPGAPLTHPDHAWLARTLAGRLPNPVGLYAEQPYTRRSEGAAQAPEWLETSLDVRAFEPVATSHRDRVAKWRAVREYASQLPLLAMRRSLRRGPLSLALEPELVAWPVWRDRMPG
jgi:LmbE family N-acetylglucosaminyl deacetylase